MPASASRPTGREAAQKWENGTFDLILLDLQMPEMNGLEATRTIRKRGETYLHIGLTAPCAAGVPE